jgi:hypothetical protein
MKKWNEQAAPNNNLKASTMEPENHASKRLEIEGLSDEEINDIRTETDIRSENL